MKARFAPLLVLLIILPGVVPAAPENGEDIIHRSLSVDGGQDLLSHVTFFIDNGQGERKKFVLAMAYKHYEQGPGGLRARVIMFNQYPPDTRNVSFMAWLYREDSGRKDDMWLYLPQLRTVRRLSHDHRHHDMKKKGEDDFDLSELQRFELQPRAAELDTHRLLGMERLGDTETYKVASTPRDPATSPYARIVRWISRDHYLPLQMEYFDHDGRLVKQQTIRWAQVDGAWVWREVEAVNRLSGGHTLLRQSEVKVNTGLADNLFTKRIMKRGPATLARMLQ